ncbi:hypothetical protein ABZ371_01210 [Streptomyces sp. NPDC005899]|uniref:hypothetical protein n=1 Tax=Streptomyces sp. NPDC005899 TaxID=3155716 RepID=UPI0034024B23
MDAEITLLASTAGTTLMTLLATDAWQSARDGLLEIWHRVRPDRVPVISAELASTREELLRAEETGDAETQSEMRVEWQGRIRRLLGAHPELAEDLRALLGEDPPDEPAPSVVTQRATASGHARVYQAGGDMHVGRS